MVMPQFYTSRRPWCIILHIGYDVWLLEMYMQMFYWYILYLEIQPLKPQGTNVMTLFHSFPEYRTKPATSFTDTNTNTMPAAYNMNL